MAYMTTSDFEERNGITLDATNFPTTALVGKWIDEATSEINDELDRDFDLDDYTDELTITQSTDIIFVKNPPINSITSVQYNSEYDAIEDETWTDIDYKVMDSTDGVILLDIPQTYRRGNVVKVVYNGGYSTAPYKVQRLCRLLVQREYINEQLQQEIGDATLTSIASIRVSEKSSTGMKLQLDRLDKLVEEAWADLKKNYYVGTFQGVY